MTYDVYDDVTYDRVVRGIDMAIDNYNAFGFQMEVTRNPKP